MVITFNSHISLFSEVGFNKLYIKRQVKWCYADVENMLLRYHFYGINRFSYSVCIFNLIDSFFTLLCERFLFLCRSSVDEVLQKCIRDF